MGPLHFGNFAGMLSKAIWFGLGFAMCYVTFTGMRLWIVRRKDEMRSLAWLERTLSIVGFGLPFGLIVSAAAFMIAMPLGSAVYWTTAAFLIASALTILMGIFGPSNDMLTVMVKRSEEHTSELQSLMRISYAVFCLKKKKKTNTRQITTEKLENIVS